MDCLSDFLRSGMMDDSVVGNTDHRINNKNNNVENMDEEGKILYSHFSESKDTGSIQSAQENAKESEELEDNIDIEEKYLQTILNCDNTGIVGSLEAESDDMGSAAAEVGIETKRSTFNKTFQDADEESCESDKLYDDLKNALGKVDYVDREYYESYNKDNKENIAYDENSVNMISDENITEPIIVPLQLQHPLKLRPIKDLLRSGVNEPFAPQQKLDPGQIHTPREKMSLSLQPQPPKYSTSSTTQPSSCTPSFQSQPLTSYQASEKSQCWASRLSQAPQLNDPSRLSQAPQHTDPSRLSSQAPQHTDPSRLSQAPKHTDLFTVHNSEATGLQSMSSQSQANQTMPPQSHENQMMPQSQVFPSMLPQSQTNQSVLPQLKSSQSTMPPSQVNQIALSPSQGTQSPMNQPINHSFVFPPQGNQLFLLPQISQTIQYPIFQSVIPSQQIHILHTPSQANQWSLRDVSPATIHQSSSPVQYRTQNGFAKSSPLPSAPKMEFGKVFPKYPSTSHGGHPPALSTSPKPASTLQTYHDPRLPPGWYLTGVIRQSGVSKGRLDFYIHGMGKRFRSMLEIVRFYELQSKTEEVDYIDYKGIEESIKTFRKQLTEQQERETGKQD